MLQRDLANGFQLSQGINSTKFCGIGDVHHTGLHRVLRGGIFQMAQNCCLNLLRGDLAVHSRNGQNLVPGGLHRTGLMHGNMTGVCAEYPLIGPQSRRNQGHIGLRTAYQKMHISLRTFTQILDHIRSIAAMLIHAVAGSCFPIGRHKTLQYHGMGPAGIITFQSNHRLFSSYI